MIGDDIDPHQRSTHLQESRQVMFRFNQSRGRRSGVKVLVALISASFVVTACGSDTSADGDKTLHVGVMVERTGALGFAGTKYENGFNLAIDEANDGGLPAGYSIKLSAENTASDPATAVQVFNRLAANKSISVVACCAHTPYSDPLAPIATRQKLAVVNYGLTGPDIPKPPYVYRAGLDTETGRAGPTGNAALLKKLVSDLKVSRTVVVGSNDKSSSAETFAVWKESVTDAGGELVESIAVPSEKTNLNDTAASVIVEKPELVVAGLTGVQGALLVKALRSRGYDGPIAGSYAFGLPSLAETAGAALDNTYYSVAFSATAELEAATAMSEAYETKYSEEPEMFAAQGYQAGKFLVAGLTKAIKAGEVTRESVAEALESVDSFDSIFGDGKTVMKDGAAQLPGSFQIFKWNADGTQDEIK